MLLAWSTHDCEAPTPAQRSNAFSLTAGRGAARGCWWSWSTLTPRCTFRCVANEGPAFAKSAAAAEYSSIQFAGFIAGFGVCVRFVMVMMALLFTARRCFLDVGSVALGVVRHREVLLHQQQLFKASRRKTKHFGFLIRHPPAHVRAASMAGVWGNSYQDAMVSARFHRCFSLLLLITVCTRDFVRAGCRHQARGEQRAGEAQRAGAVVPLPRVGRGCGQPAGV